MRSKTFDDFLQEVEKDHEIAEQEAEMRPSRDLAFLLVETRRLLDLNQRDFAKKAGVSPAYISRLESGLGNPSIRALGSLLRKVGVNLQLQAVVNSAPQEETWRVAESTSRSFSEGEWYHCENVIAGLVRAMDEARADEVPLEKERVVGSIIGTYAHSELSGQPPLPKSFRRGLASRAGRTAVAKRL